jgi:hypothetical protein
MDTPEGVIGQPIPGILDFYESGPNDRFNVGSVAYPYGQDGGPKFVKEIARYPDTEHYREKGLAGLPVTGWRFVEGGIEPPPLPIGTARSM